MNKIKFKSFCIALILCSSASFAAVYNAITALDCYSNYDSVAQKRFWDQDCTQDPRHSVTPFNTPPPTPPPAGAAITDFNNSFIGSFKSGIPAGSRGSLTYDQSTNTFFTSGNSQTISLMEFAPPSQNSWTASKGALHSTMPASTVVQSPVLLRPKIPFLQPADAGFEMQVAGGFMYNGWLWVLLVDFYDAAGTQQDNLIVFDNPRDLANSNVAGSFSIQTPNIIGRNSAARFLQGAIPLPPSQASQFPSGTTHVFHGGQGDGIVTRLSFGPSIAAANVSSWIPAVQAAFNEPAGSKTIAVQQAVLSMTAMLNYNDSPQSERILADAFNFGGADGDPLTPNNTLHTYETFLQAKIITASGQLLAMGRSAGHTEQPTALLSSQWDDGYGNRYGGIVYKVCCSPVAPINVQNDQGKFPDGYFPYDHQDVQQHYMTYNLSDIVSATNLHDPQPVEHGAWDLGTPQEIIPPAIATNPERLTANGMTSMTFDTVNNIAYGVLPYARSVGGITTSFGEAQIVAFDISTLVNY